MSSASRILISLHDVWPGNYAQVDSELQWLREKGAFCPALFVVPCYRGQRPIEEEPAFLEWVSGQAAAGSEIFAHGYRHWRSEAAGEAMRRGLGGRWMNRLARDEGEFAGLGAEDSSRLMENSFLHFRKAGIEPSGWAFPAWMGRLPPLFRLPASCRFLDGRFFVSEWRGGARGPGKWAPALTFGRSGQEPFAYGGWIWRQYLLQSGRLRIALHPGDLGHESVRSQVESLLGRGKAVSYASVF